VADREKTMTINAPVDQVYNQWVNIQNFPKMLKHIKDVSIKSPGLSHWKVELAGVTLEFDAEITQMEENKRLAWKSVSGIENSGFINFEEVPQGCQVTVHFSYTPETLPQQLADRLGIGDLVQRQVEEDLDNLKANFERGMPMAA